MDSFIFYAVGRSDSGGQTLETPPYNGYLAHPHIMDIWTEKNEKLSLLECDVLY